MKKLAALVALGLSAMGAQAAPVIIDISWTEDSNANALVEYSGTWSLEIAAQTDVIKLVEECVQSGASTVCGDGKSWTNRNGLEGDWIYGFDQSGAADERYRNRLVLSGDGQTLTFQRSQQFIDDPNSAFFPNECGLDNVDGSYSPGFGCNIMTAIFELVGPGATGLGEFELISLENCVPFGCAAPSGGAFGTATIVPVPAAVWLFGSALGLMAWVRRRITIQQTGS